MSLCSYLIIYVLICVEIIHTTTIKSFEQQIQIQQQSDGDNLNGLKIINENNGKLIFLLFIKKKTVSI